MTARSGASQRFAAAIACWLAVFGFLASFGPGSRPVLLDPATWDYMSLEIARGLIPYRDIFLHKTPGAALLGAVAARTATALGADALTAVHLLELVLAATGAALMVALCGRRSVVRGLAAAAFLVAFDQWSTAALEGMRPKIPTVTFGLGCLLAARGGRPLLAGALGGAATLCWQPGLCFLIGALAEVRDRRLLVASALRTAAGSMIPTVAMLAWLGWHGAWGDFWSSAVGFNRNYIELHARSAGATLGRVLGQLRGWNPTEGLLVVPALAGLAMRDAARTRAWPGGLTVATAVYAAMSLLSFQAWPDMILFGPGLAALLAAGLTRLLAAVLPESRAAALTLALGLAAALTPDNPRLIPEVTRQQQAEAVRALDRELAAADRVVAIGVPEFLILSGRRNAWHWPYMWFGVDRFAASRYPDGFDGLLAELERVDPKMILFARRWHGPLRQRFDDWADERYRIRLQPLWPHDHMRVYRRIQ